jgi:hypothetical protein
MRHYRLIQPNVKPLCKKHGLPHLPVRARNVLLAHENVLGFFECWGSLFL